jgi:glyoxylase-like metal-dependent hydrolase (beta-lactamase superfamily II)
MQTILPSVHFVTGLPVGRVYVIEDPDGLTLIDASIPPAVGPIMSQIKGMGRTPRDVKRILITHAHPDHVGDLPRLKALTGAQIIASAIEQPVLEGKVPVPRVPLEKLRGPLKFRPPNVTFKPTQVDLALQGGETLPVLGGLQAVFTPGHAPGHLAFWQPQQRLLFCGDVLFNAPKLGLPPAFLTVDMEENKRSFRKLMDLEPELVCFGHGRPLQKATPRLREFGRTIGLL